MTLTKIKNETLFKLLSKTQEELQDKDLELQDKDLELQKSKAEIKLFQLKIEEQQAIILLLKNQLFGKKSEKGSIPEDGTLDEAQTPDDETITEVEKGIIESAGINIHPRYFNANGILKPLVSTVRPKP